MWDDAINRRGDFQKQRVTSSVNTTYFWLASKSSCPIQCFLFHLQKCKDACFVHPFWQCIIAGVTFPRINSFEIWIWSGVGKLIAPIFFFSGFFTGPKNKVTTKFGRDFVLFMKLVCNLKKKQRRLVIGNSFSWKNEIELNCISISFGLEVNKQQCLK